MGGPGGADGKVCSFAERRGNPDGWVERLRRLEPEALALIEMVAAQQGVAVPLLLHRTRREAPIASARQLAMYLAHTLLGRSLTAVGVLFGRDRTTVAYACALVEDRRDDPVFDAEVGRLEVAIAESAAPPAVTIAEAGRVAR